MDQQKSADLGKERPVLYEECVVMDYCTYRSLDSFIVLNWKTLSSLTRTSLLVQTAMALRFIKNIHMAHCDLKSSNILLAKGYIAKMMDFGDAYISISSYLRDRTKLTPKAMETHQPGHTLPYSPPEVLRRKLDYNSWSHKIDVYSYGVLMMELLFDTFFIQVPMR